MKPFICFAALISAPAFAEQTVRGPEVGFGFYTSDSFLYRLDASFPIYGMSHLGLSLGSRYYQWFDENDKEKDDIAYEYAIFQNTVFPLTNLLSYSFTGRFSLETYEKRNPRSLNDKERANHFSLELDSSIRTNAQIQGFFTEVGCFYKLSLIGNEKRIVGNVTLRFDEPGAYMKVGYTF